MNIRLTHNPFQLNEGNTVAKQYKVNFNQQLSGQTANFVQDSSKMGAEVGQRKWG